MDKIANILLFGPRKLRVHQVSPVANPLVKYLYRELHQRDQITLTKQSRKVVIEKVDVRGELVLSCCFYFQDVLDKQYVEKYPVDIGKTRPFEALLDPDDQSENHAYILLEFLALDFLDKENALSNWRRSHYRYKIQQTQSPDNFLRFFIDHSIPAEWNRTNAR